MTNRKDDIEDVFLQGERGPLGKIFEFLRIRAVRLRYKLSAMKTSLRYYF